MTRVEGPRPSCSAHDAPRTAISGASSAARPTLAPPRRCARALLAPWLIAVAATGCVDAFVDLPDAGFEPDTGVVGCNAPVEAGANTAMCDDQPGSSAGVVRCDGPATPAPPCNGCPAGVEVPTGWVCVPAGDFIMGSPPDEIGRLACSSQWEDQIEVCITRPFLMMVGEVTQGDWKRAADIAGVHAEPSIRNPTHGLGAHPSDDCFPVERVNWFDAVWYANVRSALDGLTPCYDRVGPRGPLFDRGSCRFDERVCAPEPGWGCGINSPQCVGDYFCDGVAFDGDDGLFDTLVEGCDGYRLPTSAEWEYAARAGATSRYWSGEDDADLITATCPVGEQCDQPEATLLPPRVLPPNPWGLRAIHGNAAEWVQDAVDASIGPRALSGLHCDFRWTDHTSWIESEPGDSMRPRLIRGGATGSDPACQRSASGYGADPRKRNFDNHHSGVPVGFRLVRAVPVEPGEAPACAAECGE